MHQLLERIRHERLYFDGAMGTILQERGLGAGDLPELWNITRPEEIMAVHSAYLSAGCHIIKTNTFGANRFKLTHSEHTVSEVVSSGVALAKSAVRQHGSGYVALDVSSTGKLLSPMGDLDFEDAVSAFREMVEAGVNAGADCILIETMTDIYETKAAVLAAKEASSLPVFVTMTFDRNGKLLTGGDIGLACAVLEGLRVDAIGFNCGLGPEQMLSLLPQLTAACSLPILVNPNAGLPREVDGKTVFDIDPEEFADRMKQVVQAGASMVGGCCGTTPAHINRLIQKCSALPYFLPSPKQSAVVTSGSRCAVFGIRPLVIGERINPTGKAKFKQALRDGDIPYLLNEGIRQQDCGADILDVNVGLPEIDEQEMMCRVVKELQSVSDLPLQLDTSDPVVMEHAMRRYNGKALINSVTAKISSMQAVFPLVQKYGGVVIGLTITEEGIPETAAGRLEAARQIVETAASYGISKKDIVIDPLTMAVSAGQDAAAVTLEALTCIKSELGVATSLGVSNISFGLPQRENITAAFFLMALHSGLDAAIMNPLSEVMMTAYRSFCVLSGADENCMNYINACSQREEAPKSTAEETISLGMAIEKGLKEAASKAAAAALSMLTPLDIIQQEIVPALDRVGERFEKGTLFLPQLLMSADAAKAAFEVLKSALGAGGAESANSALTVVVATVKGDVHDIGKNIVKVLLENYGFRVIDLGKDVAPELVVETAKKERAGLVGLSALMTTTVSNMKETILLLRLQAPQCKIMVGGAVLTQEYADSIGADFYGKDAMASVRYATKLVEEAGVQ